MLSVFYFFACAVLAATIGWRETCSDPDDLRTVWRGFLKALMWCAGAQFLLALAYLGVRTSGGALAAFDAVALLALTMAVIWLPVLVIVYLGKTMRERSV